METKSSTDTAKFPGMVAYLHGSCFDYFYFVSPRGLSKQYYGEFIVPNEADKHLEVIVYSSEVYNYPVPRMRERG